MATDYSALRLKHANDPARLHQILQDQCREKTRKKLSQTLAAAPGFLFPSLTLAEMATSDTLARLHTQFAIPGQPLLDMTLGLGIDAFAMAAKASHTIAIDIDPTAAETARHNARLLDIGNIEIHTADSIAWLNDHPDQKFATIFIDPARRNNTGRHFNLSDCTPDITQTLPLLLSRSQRLIIKLSPMLDITALRRQLHPHTPDIHILGTPTECKELIAILPGTGQTTATTVKPDHTTSTLHTDTSEPRYAMPQPGHYIHEPYPAIMKSGHTDTLCRHYNTAKLHPSTHLFTSVEPINDFPGQSWAIHQIHPFSKTSIRTVSQQYPRASVATRNFPLTAPQLAAKLKTAEGPHWKIIGATLIDGQKALLILQPLQ